MRAAPRIRRLMEVRARADSSSLRIGVPQFAVLRHVEREGPKHILGLAGNALASKQTLSQLIDGLVGDGLLTRSADPTDRRKVEVSITDDGRDALIRFEAVQMQLLTGLLKDLPHADIEKLGDGLEALNDTLAAARRSGTLKRLMGFEDREKEHAVK